MALKTIAVSQSNYDALRNFGKTGMSFNDVISELIRKVQNTENPCFSDNFEKIRSEQRPGNYTQTVSSSHGQLRHLD
jgi:predicted CopG family antitoxin